MLHVVVYKLTISPQRLEQALRYFVEGDKENREKFSSKPLLGRNYLELQGITRNMTKY